MSFVISLLVAASPLVSPSSALPIPDRELATMRGGVLLPNGLNVAVGIDIQTRIDGVLALHTIYTSEQPNPGIRVYTDGTNSPATAPTTTTVTTGGVIPTVSVGRSPTGTTIVASSSSAPMTVNVVSGPTSGWLDAAGQTMVPVVANGPAVAASSGAISLANDDRGARVSLVAPSVQVDHLVGQATGAIVSNTASNRVIDTVSSVNVDLVGIPAGLSGGVLMVNRLAADAASRR
ncbi:MAG: hypothetical protein EOO77_19595 [Oxalobacteraceae bacterium]|nr:MAG: hypothetical protein EOO77_19595 [Oxalobacteraceae bacterium]